jgi:hypothetical protein
VIGTIFWTLFVAFLIFNFLTWLGCITMLLLPAASGTTPADHQKRPARLSSPIKELSAEVNDGQVRAAM